MDLFTKFNQRIHAAPFAAGQNTSETLEQVVAALTLRHLNIWWVSERSLPAFRTQYTTSEQAENDRRLEKMIAGLLHELKHIPATGGEREAVQSRLRAGALDFARQALGFEQRHLDFLENSGIIEAVQEFARMARRFDQHISADDIFQASRNVMSMNFIQLLVGRPVTVTPSVFAYSMLYPYTDNYLDDPSISRTTKLAFNHRFQLRLQGEFVRPANTNEALISDLVAMIEEEWDRARYPLVYDSLLAIHSAQSRSLKLVAPGAAPYELDVLGISFEKGGTSVLADGYLVAGALTMRQAEFLYGYGAFTQLMDDLEDVQPDLQEGRMSIFSQVAGRWPLDSITNQAFHFGRTVFADMSPFSAPAAKPLAELVTRCIDPVMVDTISRAGVFFSKAYLREVERGLPFHFTALKKQRKNLERRKVNLARLVEAFFIPEG